MAIDSTSLHGVPHQSLNIELLRKNTFPQNNFQGTSFLFFDKLEIDWNYREKQKIFEQQFFIPTGNFKGKDSFHIYRHKGSVTISTPFDDSWEVFAEAGKKMEQNTTNIKVTGGVQWKW